MMRYFLIILTSIIVACGPATKQKRIQKTFELANVKLEQAYYEEAINLYSQVIEKDPEILDAFMNRGVAYFESGRYALALADYNHVHFNYPDYPEVVFNLIYCHLELERYSQAESDLKTLKLLYPDSALVYVIEGLYWSNQNYLNNAVLSFTQAVQKDDQNFDAWTNRGIMQYGLQKYGLAERDLMRALIINENAPEALNPLSLVYAMVRDLNKADSLINIAVQLNPNNPYYLNNKGYIAFQNGNIDLADSLITRSLSINNENAWAYKNLGLILLDRGENEKALVAIKKSLNLDSTLLESYDILERYYSGANLKMDLDEIQKLRKAFSPK